MNPNGDNQVEKGTSIKFVVFVSLMKDVIFNKHRPRKIDTVIKYCISV